MSGLARVDRTDLVSNKKAAAIAEILKMRDQLVVMRERLVQLKAATAARTKKVDGLLIDCAAAGRVFRGRIGLPDWDKVLAMPGHEFIPSLEDELQEEMERWKNNRAENSPADPAAGAQDAALQERRLRAEVSFNPRRRLQHLQRPTPSHLSPNPPCASRRGDDHVAERGRRDLTIPESLTLRARGIAT